MGTFFKRNGDTITYTRVELEVIDDNSKVKIISGTLGGGDNIETENFTDVDAAHDRYWDLLKQHRREDRYYPWTAELKISMNLEKQKTLKSTDDFNELLNTISFTVENQLYDTINGEVSRDIKKIKGGLYSIIILVIDREKAVQELNEKLCTLTGNTQIGFLDVKDSLIPHVLAFTESKKLEVEIWTEDDSGFIYVTLTLGHQIYETRFSDVWNPVEDLRRWLEAICIGVEESAFVIQNEGEDTKFNFRIWGIGKALFFVGWEMHDMYMVEHVNRVQFVREFYDRITEFLNPATFHHQRNWGDDNHIKFKSKIIEEYLNDEKYKRTY